MPAERLSMRKVRDVLRLRHTLGMSFRQISQATGVGKTVVGEYVRRAGVIGITWPVAEEIDDAEAHGDIGGWLRQSVGHANVGTHALVCGLSLSQGLRYRHCFDRGCIIGHLSRDGS